MTKMVVKRENFSHSPSSFPAIVLKLEMLDQTGIFLDS